MNGVPSIIIYAILILLIICVVLLVLLLKKKNNGEYERLFEQNEKTMEKIDRVVTSVEGSVRDEFSKSRMENNAAAGQQRKELTAAFADMNVILRKMTNDNYENNIKMSETISRNLL